MARAPATVWEVRKSQAGVIRNLAKNQTFVNHYSFHIMDKTWGHLTIKMSGHPPFAAQVILNGHEYVACEAQSAGIGFPSLPWPDGHLHAQPRSRFDPLGSERPRRVRSR